MKPHRTRADGGTETIDRRQFLGRLVKASLAAGLGPAMITTVRASVSGGETRRAWRAMGTLMEVRIPDLPVREAVDVIRRVRHRVEALEAAMTLYRSESPLVMLNRLPPGRWMHVPGELVEGMSAAFSGHARSSGAFDPTVGPAMRAWGLFESNGGRVDRRLLREWRSRPPAAAVELDVDNRRARRLDARVEMDLGGVGKGIAADHALRLLAEAGSRSSLVNLGGSIGVLGPPAGVPEGWPVGIVHPRRPGEIWCRLSLPSGHLATSGDYERWVETRSGRAHHLLDPTTGGPTAGVASLTAWAPSGTEADLESTIRFVGLGRNEPPAPGSPFLALLERDGKLSEIRGQSESPLFRT